MTLTLTPPQTGPGRPVLGTEEDLRGERVGMRLPPGHSNESTWHTVGREGGSGSICWPGCLGSIRDPEEKGRGLPEGKGRGSQREPTGRVFHCYLVEHWQGRE